MTLCCFLRCAVVGCAAALALPSSAAPIITELMASNASGLKDEDGALPDWIEIFNPDPTAVNLAGWTLTDDVGRPAKWTFPGVTVAPGAYLIVFASGKDRAVAGSPLHTNFSLGAGGEFLGLFPPGGTIAASSFDPSFPAQSADVSYGLLGTEPGSATAFFPTPTPGAANAGNTSPAESPRFSLTSRTFTAAAPLTLTLSAVSPTAVIRYTTTRAVPTAAATLYTGPIPITTSTRIRARAFEPGRPDGPVVSETYLLIDPAAAAFTSPIPIVLTHTFGSGSLPNDVPVSANLMLFEPKGPDNLARLTNLPDVASPVSVERRGSSTAGAAKHSITMELWDESNADRDIPLLDMAADSDWVLHAPFEFDRSLLHNDLIYRISNDAGRWAPRTHYVEHFHSTTDGTINGAVSSSDFFGIYSLQERVKRGDNRVDVEKLTPADTTVPTIQGGYLLKVDRTGTDTGIAAGGYTNGVGTVGLVWVDPKESSPRPDQVVNTAQKAWVTSDLNAMWAAMNATNFMDPSLGYARYVDVEPTVDHHIFNTAARNLDALRLSAYWHKPRFGKWTAGPLWDFDRAMGSTDGRENGPSFWTAANSGGDFGTDFFHYKWYNEMFRDPNFWQVWVDRLDVLRQSAMSTPHVMALIDELSAPIASGGASTPVSRNFQHWSQMPPRGTNSATPGTNGTWAGEVAYLKSWWTSRLNFMDGQFTRPAVPSVAPGVVAPGTEVALTSPSTATFGVKIYYTTDGSDPRPRATERYPVPGEQTQTFLLPEISSVRTIVPASDIGTAWQGLDLNGNGNHADDFDDSLWRTNAAGTPNGVGYDDATTGTQVNYLPAIGVRFNSLINPVAPQVSANTMNGNNATCYSRIAFTLTEAQLASVAAPSTLVLQIRSDDGFVAYLNGQPVARDLAPETPLWNSISTTARADASAIAWTSFPLTSFIPLLKAGTNMLALHGMNSGVSSNDALFGARIVLLTPPPPYQAPLSPSAVAYEAPISINGPTLLTTRTLNPVVPSDPPTTAGGGTGAVPNGTGWSAVRREVFLPGAVAASVDNVVISEIHYHPSPPTAAEIAAGFVQANDFEFIRLTNKGTQPVNLTGIRFLSGVSFAKGLDLQSWLAPGASGVVVENAAAYQFRYGNHWPILGEYDGALDDGGENLILVGAGSLVISDLLYDDTVPWPGAADAGRSMLFTGGDPASGNNWTASLDMGGSGVVSFLDFQNRYFPQGGAVAGAAADADGDGVGNFAEFILGTDPLIANAGDASPLVIDSTQPLKLHAHCRKGAAGGIRMTLQRSVGLQGWVDAGVEPGIIAVMPELNRLEWELPAAAGGGFYRLNLSVP